MKIRKHHLRVILSYALLFVAVLATRSAAFLPADRWESTALGDTGSLGTPVTLTWSIAPDGTELRSGATSQFVSLLDNRFPGSDPDSALSERPWFSLLDDSFNRWSELGGAKFVYEPFDDGAPHNRTPGELGVRGDIRLAAAPLDGPFGVLATAQLPDSADIALDSDDIDFLLDPTQGYRRFRNTLMHEIGHGLGLDDIASPGVAFLMELQIGFGIDGPQIDDIRGLHHLYGDRFESGPLGNNNVMSRATDLGTLTGAGLVVGSDASPVLTDVDPASTDFVSIPNRSDRDFFSFRAGPGAIDIVLTPVGGQFQQGLVGGDFVNIDANLSAKLIFEVLDAQGGRLGLFDQAELGESEIANDLRLPESGTYFVRVSSLRNAPQLYSLRISSTIVPEPTSLSTLLVLFIACCAYRSCACAN